MTPLRTAVALSLSLLALSCTSTELDPTTVDDIRASSSLAEGATLEGKTTYAWGGAVQNLLEPGTEWTAPADEVVADIKRSTNEALAANGRTETADTPALRVYYGVGVDMTRMNIVGQENVDYLRLDSSVKVGLCVLIVDEETKQHLWAGVASGNIEWAPTEAGTQTRIQYAIEKMFAKFPG